MADTAPTPTPQKPGKKSYYGKKSIGKWILIYLVAGGLVYFLIYYFANRGGGSIY